MHAHFVISQTLLHVYVSTRKLSSYKGIILHSLFLFCYNVVMFFLPVLCSGFLEERYRQADILGKLNI